MTPIEQEIVYLLGFEPKHIPLLTGVRIDPLQKCIEVRAAPEAINDATDAGGRLPHFRCRSGPDLVFGVPHERAEFAVLRKQLAAERGGREGDLLNG